MEGMNMVRSFLMGNIKLRCFDYEFFVEVDNTPPDVNLTISRLYQNNGIHADLRGHAYDDHIKNWVIEYGEGENPRDWFEFTRGADIIVERDEEGNPILNPLKDTG